MDKAKRVSEAKRVSGRSSSAPISQFLPRLSPNGWGGVCRPAVPRYWSTPSSFPDSLGDLGAKQIRLEAAVSANESSSGSRQSSLPTDTSSCWSSPAIRPRSLSTIAVERDADLIVVGPHHGHPALENFVGSTAHRLMHESIVPVLLAVGIGRPSSRQRAPRSSTRKSSRQAARGRAGHARHSAPGANPRMASNSAMCPSTTRLRASSFGSSDQTPRSDVPPRMIPSLRGCM